MYSTFVDTTWTKYAKILKSGGYFNISQGSTASFSLGIGDGQGGLVCYSSWGHKESDMTKRLNGSEPIIIIIFGKICFPSLLGSFFI